MATRSKKRHSALTSSQKFRDLKRKKARRLHLEQLEDRRVMAIFVLPNNGVLLNNNVDTRTVAPQDLTFRFTDIPGLDPSTVTRGVRLTRAGGDGQFGQANDVIVAPGFIGLGDTNREIVMRFAETLPDDTYRITVFDTGPNALLTSAGGTVNEGSDFTLNFRLDLGAQVVAVVPQPIRRNASGGLEMTEVVGQTTRSTANMVYVYFNNDDLSATSATRPEFYRLYITRNTLDPQDDVEIIPTSVEYDPATDLVKLIFGQAGSLDQLVGPDGSRDPIKSLRLRIGTSEARRLPTTVTRLGTNDPGSSFATARDLGIAVTVGSQGASAAFAQAIDAQPYDLDWPGGTDEPGHRDIPFDSHLPDDGPPAAGGLNALFDTVDGVTTVFYNFRPEIGVIPGGVVGSQPAFNLITENQKQRAREVFELYSKYSGVQFVETEDSGLIVATGDMRAVIPPLTSGPGGTQATSGVNVNLQPLAVMDNGEVWNDQYGENWFQIAMHEIGHLLGQGHTYDLPPLTIQGQSDTVDFNSPAAEPVFPGDHDIVHMRHSFRPEGKDIDLYRFVLDGTGVLTVETFAERLPDSSNLDTHLRLYRVGAGGVIEEIARNDDYFSKDSLLQLNLGPGTYFIGVSAAGNDQYDPTIVDSGMGGTTQGIYELKFDFRKSASDTLVDATRPSGLIVDTLNVAFDGDADGTPGGVHNFWFRAAPNAISPTRARTIFVDKLAPAGGNGLLSLPFQNIDDALAVAQPFDIVRIVGNDPNNNDGGTAANRYGDNRAYQIGFDDFGQVLADGPELTVPKDVTVMIDAGAIFQMRRSQVSVGSTSPSINSDRSGGALQVLGIPGRNVFFTSYNEVGPNSLGQDTNPLSNPASPGDWGGLAFANDLDRADGRFDHEQVGVFLNYVNQADIRFGGGQVNVNSVFQVVTPINIVDRRPTVSFNTITKSADAAMSANPDSFEETNFQAPRYWSTFSSDPLYNPSQIAAAPPSFSYTLDYSRVGPDIHGNRVTNNTTNALFVRTRTAAGNELEELTVAGRFDDNDIVHVIQENLVVRGTPGGATLEQTPPPINLIIPNIIPGQQPFGFQAGTEIEYKLVYIDLLGNEGLASESFFVVGGVPVNGAGVLLTQLPNPAIPNPEFVARRLYRRIGTGGNSPSGEFTLVDQIPASVSEYLDRNLPVSGQLQRLKVLATPLTVQRPRLDASLVIDPTLVIKSDGSRIDVGIGANLLAEGFAGREIIFTSLSDDRYGAGGTFDNNNDNQITLADPVINTLTAGATGVNERQSIQLVGNPVSGAFTLTFNGQTTAAIPFNATAQQLQTALENLNNINLGDVAVTFAAGVWTVTFTGDYAGEDVPQLIGKSVPVGDSPNPGDWGGIFFSADSKGSIDNAVIAYAGGLNRIEGTFAGFNAIEIHQAEVRVAQSKFEFNDPGQGGQAPIDRFGRGFNRPGTIFVRGAQPIILENTVLNNSGPFININVNALNYETVVDTGRQSGLIERRPGHLDNNGPLIVGNRLRGNELNGMIVRGATLTTQSVWDDTDIVHILLDAINVPDFHAIGGLRLESSATESLVVKAAGPTAGITATGRPLEIDDRIGGIVQILGQPGFPVVLTSLTDDTEGAGFTPEGIPQVDTNGGGLGIGTLPTGLEVDNGTTIDNDVDPVFFGSFEYEVGPAGNEVSSSVSVQGRTQPFISQDFILEYLSYIDIGPAGGAIDLATTTITRPPTLVSDDLVVTEGNFMGDNGQINWIVETRIDDGSKTLSNTLRLTSLNPLGALQLVSYFDQDIGQPGDDILVRSGSPGQASFRILTLDNVERVGFGQGGIYSAGPGLVNATWNGWAAAAGPNLENAITGAGGTYARTGAVQLPQFFDPALGTVNGLADVTSAMAWTVDPLALTATITTLLDLVPSAPASSGTPGEWQGITFDQYAHDRNVETILEQEAAIGDGLANAIPQKAQFIGSIGPFEKGGDENLRLGFTVHGLINNTSDADVYSFAGRTGTEVWIDLDRTTHALDTIVELIDNNGIVLARSNNSEAENAGAETLTGLARKMQKSAPYSGQDFYTTNPRDAAMRVVLPGPANTTNTYFIRVRSSSAEMQVKSLELPVSTLQDGSSGTVVTTLTPGGGGVNEVQRVELPAGATWFFDLTFNGQTTGGIVAASSAQGVQSQLEQLPNIDPGDVVVTRESATSYRIEFAGQYANQNVAPLTLRVHEAQRFLLDSLLPGHTYTLTFDGQTTAPISTNDNPFTIQQRLLDLPNLNSGDFFLNVGQLFGGANIADVVFLPTGSYAGQNVPQITVNFGNELQRIIQPPAASGNFTLTFNGLTTGVIPFNASPAFVQAALEGLSNINPGDILVTSPTPGTWDVRFQGQFANQNVPQIVANGDGLVPGVTTGAYQLQVRLRELDEHGGSTVRFAKIANAVNGIRVLGQPLHSPLAGERAENEGGGSGNDLRGGSNDLGNLLATDRGNMAIAGNLSTFTDVDWFRVEIDFTDFINDPLEPQPIQTLLDMVFDMDYADGLARPNTQIYVFDTTGRLILSSRDSNIAEDRPGPAPGAQVSDLTRGSQGQADPYIGNISLPASVQGAVVDGTIFLGRDHEYFVAVTNVGNTPFQLDQFTQAAATAPLARLEPLDSVHRIVEDHINEGSFANRLRPDGAPPRRGTSDLPEVEVLLDANSEVPFNLGDVVMFVARDMTGVIPGGNNTTDLVTVDPFTGQNETWVGRGGRDFHDLALRSDERLFGLAQDLEGGFRVEDATAGNYYEISHGNGAITQLGDDNIQTFELDLSQSPPPVVRAHPVPDRIGYGIQYNAWTFGDLDSNGSSDRLFGVGDRGEATFPGTINPYIERRTNILYQLNQDTGAAHVPGQTPPGSDWTNVFEMGEILTRPRISAPEATVLNTSGGVDAIIRDGQNFDITDGNVTQTFEFDSGPEVFQNVNPSGDVTMRDGEFFILDQDNNPTNKNEYIFQVDTGQVIAVAATANSSAIPDATTFTVTGPQGNSFVFEFDRDTQATITQGNVRVDVSGALLNAAGIAARIVAAIDSQFNANTFAVDAALQAGQRRISLITTPPSGFVSVSPVAALSGVLRVEGAQFAAPVLEAIDPALIPDGATFRLTKSASPITFEFDKGGGVTAGNTPVDISTATTADQVAQAMTDAINNQGQLDATRFVNRVVVNGPGVGFTFLPASPEIVNLMDVPSNGGLAGRFQIPMEESDTNTAVVTAIVNAVNNSIPTAHFSAFGEAGTGTAARINFPPLTGPNLLAAQSLDATGMPRWTVDTSSATGVQPGHVAIPFGASDPQAFAVGLPGQPTTISQRIGDAINADPVMDAAGIKAAIRAQFVELTNGFLINNNLPVANPPAIPNGFIFQGEGPGGSITGLVQIDSNDVSTITFLALSNLGGLYVVQGNWLANQNGPSDNTITRVDYVGSVAADFEDIEWQGLTRGPRNVEPDGSPQDGGRYAETFFAVADSDGVGSQSRLYAFEFDWLNDAGQPRIDSIINNQGLIDQSYRGLSPVFLDGQTNVLMFATRVVGNDSVREPLTNARGVVFSNLDQNPWQITPFLPSVPDFRQTNPGHGVNPSPNGSRPADTGNSSYFFGRNGVGSTYSWPGGAYGSLVSNEFDLTDYSAGDQPVLYFNYFSAQEANQDRLRVFISGTANENRDTNFDGVSDTNSGQWFQLAFTDSNVFTNQGWRQARIPLGAFAGRENLRLRFDFSTSGEMNVGDLLTTGEEIRTVAGQYVTDGQFIRIDHQDGTDQDFEVDLGFSLFTSSGRAIPDGETFTIAGPGGTRTFEFNKPATPGANPAVTPGNTEVRISDTESAVEVAQIIINLINAAPIGVTPQFVDQVTLADPVVLTLIEGSPSGNENQSIQLVGNVAAPVFPPPPATGAFTLTFDGETTFTLFADATAFDVQQALEFLPNINPGDVAVTFANGIYTVQFQGQYANFNVPQLVANAVGTSTQIIDNWINLKGATTLTRTGAGALAPVLTQTGAPGVRAPLPGNRPTITIDLHRAMTRVEVANVLDPLLEDAFTTSTLVTQSGVNYRDGTVFELFDGVNTRRYEFESGPLLRVLPAGVAGTFDGDTFTLDPDGAGPIVARTFELDSNQSFNGANVQVQFATNNNAAAIANAIATQVRATFGTVATNARVVVFGGETRVQFDAPDMAPPSLAQVPADYNPDMTVTSTDFSTAGTAAGVAAGNTPIMFSPATNFFAQDVSRNITAAINNPIVPPGQPQFPGLQAGFNAATPSRVNLVSVNNVQLNTNFVQPPGTANPFLVLQTVTAEDLVKQDADLLRLIGRRVEPIFGPGGQIIEYMRGPFGLVTERGPSQLPGDVPDRNGVAPEFDGYRSNLRGQNNNFEGFYLDDIIIGLAERGELVTHGGQQGDDVTDFRFPPLPPPGEVVTGEYQLEVRRGSSYEFVSLPFPGFTADSNDRSAEQTTLFAPTGAQLRDGQTFTIGDGINRVTFEFNDLAILPNNVTTNVTAGNQRIDFRAAMDNHEIARRMRDAINSPQVQATLKVMAQIGDGTLAGNFSTSDRVNLVGPATLQIQGNFAPEINDIAANATSISPIGAVYNGAQFFTQGTIGDNPVKSVSRDTQDEDIDLYQIVLAAGQRIRIDVDARTLGTTDKGVPVNAGTYGSTLDSVLRVFNSAGVELAFSDDTSGPGEPSTFDSFIEFIAPAFGTYFIGVTGFGLTDAPPFPQVQNPDYDIFTGVLPAGDYSKGFYQLEISSALTSSIPNVSFIDQRGDQNQFRDQGQIILQGNEIRASSQWGILIDAAARQGADGNAAHPGPVRVLREPNVERLLPGVVVMNNVIHNNTAGGIRFSGDSATLTDGPIPFGRIVNNTLFGQGGFLTGANVIDTGIQVDEGAAPTLMNNIVVNFERGVFVDPSSQGTAQVPRTVLGGMLYQGNGPAPGAPPTNVGLGGDFPLDLNPNEPLFVNPAAANFYLAATSRAIDSSVDSLLDRPALVTVRNPMGIPVSNIISPDRDLSGLLRVDDPSVSTPQGFGLNPFKDRGAIDRVDFVGPTSILINPPDNDALGSDLDPATTVVVRSNDIIRDFTIRLIDRFDPNGPPEGSDIDDLTVTSAQVRVETIASNDARVFVEGEDYTFAYDTTNNLIVLTPLGGLWPMGATYRVTLDLSAATGIKDRAGNPLLPNQTDGTHTYTIFIGSAIDYGDAPDSYGTLKANNGPSHQMVPTVRLGPSIGAEADGQPSATANADASDDGISEFVLFPGGAVNSSTITVLASFPTSARLDGWIDLNRDGDFDATEYVIQGRLLTTPDVPQAVPFTLPNGPRGTTIARFRLSTDGINTPTGPAEDGEVEDYQVTLIGPQFQNGNLKEDVNNDGVVSVLDLLLVINFQTTLFQSLISGATVFVPPTAAHYNPVPSFDPTGGNVPGQGRFIDVTGDGIVGVLDLSEIITYITLNFVPGGSGEGESQGFGGEGFGGEDVGEGESAPAMRMAAAGSTLATTVVGTRPITPAERDLFTASLLAAPNIILEVRERVSDVSPLAGDWTSPGDDDTLALVAAAAVNEQSVGRAMSLEEHARRRLPIGPLEDEAWDDLLGELALDVGGLPDEPEDQA